MPCGTPTLVAVIEKRGPVWKGDSFEDLREYLVAFTAAAKNPAGTIVESVCACGGTIFGLCLDDDEGCAQRRCVTCSADSFIADSAEHWADADPGEAQCPCGEERFGLAVAFSTREDGDIRWVTVGARCLACGMLGAYVDWRIDYSPASRLLGST